MVRSTGGRGRLISTSDFAGWEHSGAGSFDVATRDDEVVYLTRGGMGLLWWKRPLADFVVSFDFRVFGGGGNSGLFVRVPDPGDPSYVNHSFEVQIDPNGAGTSATGAIYDVQPPLVPVVPRPGAWYRMEVRAEGEEIEARIDDDVVNLFRARRGGKVTSYELEGHLALQNHSDADRVAFRDIRLEVLAGAGDERDAGYSQRWSARSFSGRAGTSRRRDGSR